MSRVVTGRKELSIQSIGCVKERDKDKYIAIKSTQDEGSGDNELFNFWRQIQLPGGANINRDSQHGPVPFQGEAPGGLSISRKRKAWEGGPISGNKYIGSGRLPPATGSDEEERTGLETPQCSRTGFPDDINEAGDQAEDRDITPNKNNILSPMNPNLLNDEDIDADNLAADFDGSFTGLGVDINTANYSMSEAMLSLNNIALENHQMKQEDNRLTSLKSDAHYIFSSYGALDLSNDEAQHPNHNEDTPSPTGPQTFSGSVSRDNSQDSLVKKFQDKKSSKMYSKEEIKESKQEIISPSHQYQLSKVPESSSMQKNVLIYGDLDKEGLRATDLGFGSPKLEIISSIQPSDEELDSSFQYILTAPTSIATKIGEPSLTYINQGQSYELKIKKLGDLSNHYKKKWLRSTIRICFHERRLQYIENEQISEWARTHPNQRILEVDLPLSYGIAEVKQDTGNLSTVSFSWDPTRETGVFIKVHCISTEFTPKKHGGERGVPFRLQVETWWSDARIHAAACILQVFKLKGADRKHKQDREKVQKRTVAEREKFSPQYECTVLTDLSVDSIYIPPSRGISPIQSDGEGNSGVASAANIPVKAASLPPASTREESPYPPRSWMKSPSVQESKSWRKLLPNNASVEMTTEWLSNNRYNQHLKTLQNFDSRDLLRLSKDDLIQMIGILDGIRLFNDLHMKPVSPRLLIYLAQKGDSMFYPFLLEDVTTAELVKLIAQTFEIPKAIRSDVVITGPNKILVKMTDEYLRYQNSDSAFYFYMVYGENGDSATVHLEHVPSA